MRMCTVPGNILHKGHGRLLPMTSVIVGVSHFF